MNPLPAFTSPLASVITRYLDLKIALGRRYATERQLFRGLDTFLVAEHAAELTLEVFERWCQTQAHRKFHIPPDLVVRGITAHRKPPDVRIWRLRNQSCVGTVPSSTSTPHWPACLARR